MPGQPVAGQFADEPMSVFDLASQSDSEAHHPPPSSLPERKIDEESTKVSWWIQYLRK